MRISDWGSDVCSSDLLKAFYCLILDLTTHFSDLKPLQIIKCFGGSCDRAFDGVFHTGIRCADDFNDLGDVIHDSSLSAEVRLNSSTERRSEEHTSELQSLMRNSYAVFCLKKKKTTIQQT